MRVTIACLEGASSALKLPRRRRFASGEGIDRRLTHVTSGELCDDILRLLGPTLPPPHTCDVIDLNPGVCLWSQKLNQILKPRRHVLVEPRINTFSEFVNPLLQEPNSSYRLAPDIKSVLEPSKEYLSNDTYEFRKRLEKEGGPKYALNKNLIITANLSGTGRQATGFHGSEAKQFFNEFYRSIFVRDQFLQRYGLTRLLAWVGEDARIPVMPMTVNARSKQSIQLESACTVTQIAGPSSSYSLHPHQQRWYYIDVEDQQNVRIRQKELGLNIPPGRDQPEPLLPFVALKPTVEEVRQKQHLYPYHRTFSDKLLELDRHLSTEDPEWYEMYEAEASSSFADKSNYIPANKSDTLQRAYRRARTQMRTQHNTFMKVKDFVWEQRQNLHKYQKAWRDGWLSPTTGLPVEGPHKQESEQLIMDDQVLATLRQRIKADTRKMVQKAGDDWRCRDSNPPSMAWNRRQHDPLLVREDEFLPNKPLTLYDFTPDPKFPTKIDTIDKQICFDHVCTMLMTTRGDTVVQSIKRLIPGGYEEFLERLPQLRDPTRGGWYDLESVGVRSLHHDHFIDIALAFHDWPHRPPIEKLMIFHKGVFSELPK